MANSADGYAYLYMNAGSGTVNTNDGYTYVYENVGANQANSNDGYAYTYVNALLYVIDNTEGMPPMIN